MECLAVPKLPNGLGWLYEIKLDGYRAIAVKSGGSAIFFPGAEIPSTGNTLSSSNVWLISPTTQLSTAKLSH
jgi:hypothetical protein